MSDIMLETKYDINYFKAYDPENCRQIKPYQTELEKSRLEDLKSVMESVNEVRNDLESLKCEVFKNLQIQNLDYLRKYMFNMEGKITDLKEAIKEELLTLLKNEASLYKDVQFMERRIEDWGKPIDVHIYKPIKQSNFKIKKKNSDNPVEEFQKFLSNSGGHYGRWEEQDHLLFLKERVKYKKKEKFFSALQDLLPDLSYEIIEEHENWYQKYEILKNNQKEAIQKWKLDKQNQQNQQKQEKEKEDVKKEKQNVKKEVRQRINIAERIKNWKNQQLLKKLEEEERMKKEKEKLKEEEKRKQEMQEMKKLAVMQYKAEKLSKFQEVFPKENKKLLAQEAKAKNKVLLKAFRLQDLKFMEKKKIIRLQIESKSMDNRLKLTKPALEFILQRDPQRIFQPTLIWSQHCLESQKREKVDRVFDLNSIPRLAIPEWRRELK